MKRMETTNVMAVARGFFHCEESAMASKDLEVTYTE